MGKVYSAKELIKIIEADGWYFVRQKGSHAQYKHPVKKNLTTVPMHDVDVKKGTAANVFRQAGIEKESEGK
jgi:predicted RNA binding protein YcfA (HicA-like mRNA interferase family)